MSQLPFDPDTVASAVDALRPGAWLAVATAVVDHADGDDDAALGRLGDADALGANLADGESLLQATAGSQMARSAGAAALHVLHGGSPTGPALRRHAQLMRELRGRVATLGASLAYDAAGMDSQLRAMASGGLRGYRNDRRMVPEQGESGCSDLELAGAHIKAEETRVWLADRYARLIEEADKPPKESRYASACVRARRDAEARRDRLSAMLFSMDTAHFAIVRRLPTQLSGEEVVAALELYQREHGDYPEGLDALVPAYVADLPPDPFTGDPLVYRVVKGGYLLYSLGPNMVDDGGITLVHGCMPDQVMVDDRGGYADPGGSLREGDGTA